MKTFDVCAAAVVAYSSTNNCHERILDSNSRSMAAVGFKFAQSDDPVGFNGITFGACGGALNRHCYGSNAFGEDGEYPAEPHFMVVG